MSFTICNELNAQNNESVDSLKQSIAKSKEVFQKVNKLKAKPIKVEIINTCSTKPELCGNMAFGSVSLVKILEGEYIGEIIYVVSTCSKTNYQIGQIYKMNASFEPGFSVHLCNGKTYNSDWNYKLDENEHFLVFGSLN
ncbi:hypothetical protein [Aureivirga sp. CE67]|uniref:hypothetical protein n=1 Tax=Aureivirga sp. CE67 TaxID=1788983 RepID=UPI0018CA6D1D|nr:hypothetical protein [Aureivirga sp. CE67]